MMLIKKYTGKAAGKNLYLSVSLTQGEAGENKLNLINEVISRHGQAIDLRRFDERSSGLDATYLLDVESTDALSKLSDDLRKQFPDVGITFLDQNGMPGI